MEEKEEVFEFTKTELVDLLEWTRVNGQRWRGNLQKNGIELFKQYLKEKENDKSYSQVNTKISLQA